MKFKAILKRRFRKAITEIFYCEDQMWAIYVLISKYPKHKIVELKPIS